ncbi:hypothetical protein Vretimale_17170, partial [Volvox reticuliferus]
STRCSVARRTTRIGASSPSDGLDFALSSLLNALANDAPLEPSRNPPPSRPVPGAAAAVPASDPDRRRACCRSPSSSPSSSSSASASSSSSSAESSSAIKSLLLLPPPPPPISISSASSLSSASPSESTAYEVQDLPSSHAFRTPVTSPLTSCTQTHRHNPPRARPPHP